MRKKRKKRKGIWIDDVGPEIHRNIKVLAIAEGKFMYELVKELLAEALEQRRLQYEDEEESKGKRG